MADLSKDPPLRAVQVEALVVMKIIKHCAQLHPTPATGFLVGMDVKGVLQATNAYPFPTVDAPATADGGDRAHHDGGAGAAANLAAAAPRARSNAAYQAEMIRNLREANIDANGVGWYTGANMGAFINSHLVENQYQYQKELNERTVALVHDVGRSSQGALSLRAFRLAPTFMAAFQEGKFTTESLQKSGLRYQDILLELPLTIHNSHLLTAFLHQLPTKPSAEPPALPTSLAEITQLGSRDSSRGGGPGSRGVPAPLCPNFDALDLSVDPFLERTCDLLLDGVEAHGARQNDHQYWQRQLAREQAKIAQWQARRKAENAARALAKQSPLPEDEWQRLFKLPAEPSRLDVLLNSRQIEQYARQVDGYAACVSGKMFAARGNLLPGEAKEA